ncbi:MAG: hypothetical protein LBN07_05245 [Christensenellaceae bacterium]|jgi:hypothetical protein|nr:hypothetical protein [Christensenellaceae bacterium]
MNKRKSILFCYKEVCKLNSVILEDKDVIYFKKLFKKVHEYVIDDDLINNTKHSKIFHMLFLSNKNIIYRRIGEIYYVSQQTVRDCVSRFDKIAKKFMERDEVSYGALLFKLKSLLK